MSAKEIYHRFLQHERCVLIPTVHHELCFMFFVSVLYRPQGTIINMLCLTKEQGQKVDVRVLEVIIAAFDKEHLPLNAVEIEIFVFMDTNLVPRKTI